MDINQRETPLEVAGITLPPSGTAGPQLSHGASGLQPGQRVRVRRYYVEEYEGTVADPNRDNETWGRPLLDDISGETVGVVTHLSGSTVINGGYQRDRSVWAALHETDEITVLDYDEAAASIDREFERGRETDRAIERYDAIVARHKDEESFVGTIKRWLKRLS